MDFDPNEDFEFGAALPSDESERAGSPDDGETFDALNDETFGGAVGPVPKDFSDFAANSLALELEGSKLNEDECNVFPLPGTHVHAGNYGSFMKFGESQNQNQFDEQQALKAQEEALRNIQNIWGPGGSGFDKFNEQMGFHPSFGSMMSAFGEGFNRAPSPPKEERPSSLTLGRMPPQALTVEEIERQQLMKVGSVKNRNDTINFPRTPGDKSIKQNTVANVPNNVADYLPRTSDWVLPATSMSNERVSQSPRKSGPTAVTVEELEKRIMEDCNKAAKENQGPHSGFPPMPTPQQGQSGFRPPGPFPFSPGMPMMTPMIIQQMWMQYQQMTMAAVNASGAPPESLPPWIHSNIPPAPFVSFVMSRMPFPPGMPPMGPPNPMMNQGPRLTPGAQRGNQQMPFNQHLYGSKTGQSGSSSPASNSSRRMRKEGMPSIRTITDFACDPFAGFMSKKEREWLIKIQLIQCAGTGDKYVDDYYYTMWKQHNELAKPPEDWQQPKIQSKYYNLEETYPSNYTPPSFSGALGKPTHATTSFPRQCFKLLDLQPNDDDDESVVGGSVRDSNKRKSRTILLTIENAYLYLLEIDDLRRKMEEDPNCNYHAAIAEKLSSIYAMVLDEAHIPTSMLVSKGRRLIIRVLVIAESALKIQILANVFNTLRKYSKKVSNSPYDDFIRAALISFCAADGSDLITFVETMDADRFKETLNYSIFSQNLFTALLIACAKRGLKFDGSISQSSLSAFLRSERGIFNGLGAKFTELFSLDDLKILKQWLSSLHIRAPGTVVDNLLICVSSKV